MNHREWFEESLEFKEYRLKVEEYFTTRTHGWKPLFCCDDWFFWWSVVTSFILRLKSVAVTALFILIPVATYNWILDREILPSVLSPLKSNIFQPKILTENVIFSVNVVVRSFVCWVAAAPWMRKFEVKLTFTFS